MLIAQTYMPMVLEHLKEHMTFYYVEYNYDLLMASTGLNDREMGEMLKLRTPEVRKELDKNLAVQSQIVMPAVEKVLSGLMPIIEQTSQQIQEMQPEPEQLPMDPNTQMAIEQEQASDEMRDARERESTQLQLVDKKEAREQVKEIKFMELDATARESTLRSAREDARKAQEYAARLEELMERLDAEREETLVETGSREDMNAEDNVTALAIADTNAKAAKQKGRVTTGEGLTNPRP